MKSSNAWRSLRWERPRKSFRSLGERRDPINRSALHRSEGPCGARKGDPVIPPPPRFFQGGGRRNLSASKPAAISPIHPNQDYNHRENRKAMRPIRRFGALLALSAFAALLLLASPAPALGAAGDDKAPRVNVNTATVEDLTSLPGIGPSYAKRIMEYREKNGPFKRVEDLLNVQGIGDKTLERIRDKVTVSSGK